jgi:hypothetical protein
LFDCVVIQYIEAHLLFGMYILESDTTQRFSKT